MTKKGTRKKYQPPLVDLLECRVERGFWGSGGLEGFSYGNYYGSPNGNNGSGRAEGFTGGNSYGGAKFN